MNMTGTGGEKKGWSMVGHILYSLQEFHRNGKKLFTKEKHFLILYSSEKKKVITRKEEKLL